MWIPTLFFLLLFLSSPSPSSLATFFFFFYFCYYRNMIMTIMIMKTIMTVLNLKCISKEKVCILHCALLIVSLETSVRSSRPGSSTDGFNPKKKCLTMQD